MSDAWPVLIPAPAGVQAVAAVQNVAGDWTVETRPLAYGIVESPFEPASYVDAFGDMIRDGVGRENALLFADGRVCVPGCDIFSDTGTWLASVIREQEQYEQRAGKTRNKPVALNLSQKAKP